ncbi:MAG TPA: rhodanese-like domain-containing protein [Gammaproteobacteria bacterium]
MTRLPVLILLLLGTSLLQAEVRITPDLAEVRVPTADGAVVIQRNQDPDATIDPAFSLTSRNCPPFCIQPMTPAPGVTTVGELELLEFLQGGGLLIDGRTENWFLEETIPGALNIPYTEMAVRLDELGCQRGSDRWDCSEARPVLLFCNGAWCGQSPTAIRAMVREGYPAQRIFYYRGGMQAWKSLGLTTVPGSF